MKSSSNSKRSNPTTVTTFTVANVNNYILDDLDNASEDTKHHPCRNVSLLFPLSRYDAASVSKISAIIDDVVTDTKYASDILLHGACATPQDILYYLIQVPRRSIDKHIARIRRIMDNNNSRITTYQLELDSPFNYKYNIKEQMSLDNSRITEIEQDCSPVQCRTCGNSILVRVEPPSLRRADEGTSITYRCNRIRDHPDSRIRAWSVKG